MELGPSWLQPSSLTWLEAADELVSLGPRSRLSFSWDLLKRASEMQGYPAVSLNIEEIAPILRTKRYNG
jgi:hypothetical protein